MPRRQHDDGHGRSLADLATDVDTGHVGKAEIEHDEIRPIVRRGLYSSRSGRRFIDAHRDIAERVAHGAANLGLVVDDQHEVGIRHMEKSERERRRRWRVHE
jgi:hypothetical protein